MKQIEPQKLEWNRMATDWTLFESGQAWIKTDTVVEVKQ